MDGRTRTISDSIENDRMSRVERLLMQTIGRLESQDEQLKVLKNKLDLTENTNRFARWVENTFDSQYNKNFSSTPFSKEKRAPQREKTQNRVEREMKKVVKVHEKNPAFLLSLLPLLSIANSDDIVSGISCAFSNNINISSVRTFSKWLKLLLKAKIVMMTILRKYIRWKST